MARSRASSPVPGVVLAGLAALAAATWLVRGVVRALPLPDWALPVALVATGLAVVALLALASARGGLAGAPPRVKRWLAGEDRLGASPRHWRGPDAPAETATAPRMRFRVPDGTPERALRKATDRALRAARDAVPGRAKVRVRATIEDIRGPDSIVTVRLSLIADRVDGEWVAAARSAFEREFLARVAGSALPRPVSG